MAFLARGPAIGDQVTLKNGDKITGTIQSSDAGKLVLAPSFAADMTVSIPLDQVATFSSEKPVKLVLKNGTIINQPVAAAVPGQVTTAQGGSLVAQPVEVASIEKINPPPVHWTGAIAANAFYSDATTQSIQFGLTADATRRSDNDRIIAGASYQYDEQKTGRISSTSANNWFAQGEYDYFFDPKIFGFGSARAEQDHVNFLDLRLVPSAGVGYQWIEHPNFNVYFKGGLAWIYEDYSTLPNSHSSIALNLSYHLDKAFNDGKIKVFNDIALFPSLENSENFLALVDGGVRFALTKTMFSQISINLNYDNNPAPGAEKTRTQYIFGFGSTF